ncbi:hypothetical protein ACERII_12470 [Evansella sp. AB-rgal1]
MGTVLAASFFMEEAVGALCGSEGEALKHWGSSGDGSQCFFWHGWFS